jgi:hypothetical protein
VTRRGGEKIMVALDDVVAWLLTQPCGHYAERLRRRFSGTGAPAAHGIGKVAPLCSQCQAPFTICDDCHPRPEGDC